MSRQYKILLSSLANSNIHTTVRCWKEDFEDDGRIFIDSTIIIETKKRTK